MKLFTDELTEIVYAIIEHEDGSMTSMLKSVWDDLNVDSEGNK